MLTYMYIVQNGPAQCEFDAQEPPLAVGILSFDKIHYGSTSRTGTRSVTLTMVQGSLLVLFPNVELERLQAKLWLRRKTQSQ